MNPDLNNSQSSISIINRNNGTVGGESVNALPIKFIGGLSWIKFIIIGFIISLLFMIWFVATVKKQVVAVEVSGRAENFQIFEIK